LRWRKVPGSYSTPSLLKGDFNPRMGVGGARCRKKKGSQPGDPTFLVGWKGGQGTGRWYARNLIKFSTPGTCEGKKEPGKGEHGGRLGKTSVAGGRDAIRGDVHQFPRFDQGLGQVQGVSTRLGKRKVEEESQGQGETKPHPPTKVLARRGGAKGKEDEGGRGRPS